MRTVLVFVGLLFCFSAPVFADDRVYVCDDIRPWPPYTYPSPSNSASEQTQTRTGAMVDFLDAIMKQAGFDYVVKLKPWKRCLKELEAAHRTDQAEVMIGAAFNEERSKFAYFTRQTHFATNALFYSEEKFPDGVSWKEPGDTHNFVTCRVRSYNYSNVMPIEDSPSLEAKSLEIALQHLKRGRCDIAFSSVEAVMGSQLYGDTILPEGVTFKEYVLEQGIEDGYRIMVSKQSPRGEELRLKLDQAISRLIADGTRDKIFESYYRLMNK